MRLRRRMGQSSGTGEFQTFYRVEYNRVARLLGLTFGDPDLGFEATDEAMLRAYERWDAVGALTNPTGWVYRTGHNWGQTQIRRAVIGRDKIRLIAPDEGYEATPSDPDLAAALEQLDTDRRAVVVLRFYADWSVDQISEALDLPAGTVKSRLSRAMRQLATQLGPRVSEPTNAGGTSK